MNSTADIDLAGTVTLLESRLLRIENALFGATQPIEDAHYDPAADAVETLERRFNALLGRIKVYGELMRLYRTHPSLFTPTSDGAPPLELSPEAVQATVIAAAASFPSTASALTSVSDCPIPDTAQSAALAALRPRMRGLEATQDAQLAEMAELRARSEKVIQAWYEDGVIAASRFVADAEGRISKADRRVRRAEKDHEVAEAF